MATITLISPKGGVGKTTGTVVLADQLALQAEVTIIDADKNRPVEAWSRLPGRPDRISVISQDVSETTIVDHIEEAASRTPFVLVDCEGSASLSVAYAIASADLVVIPTQASQLDARQAARALGLVKDQVRLTRRPIPTRILFTRSSPAIRTRTLDNVQRQFADNGVQYFQTHLHEREAFRAMFSFGGSLMDLDSSQVSNRAKAVENAQRLAAEVLQLLKEEGAA
ncbi:ParA family protein [Brevundimonas nasdae]|uniref:nucleotide-binding protein n=1 Tax=Brevundimonas nasdae TaxID=172043 RepID=UPI003F68E619